MSRKKNQTEGDLATITRPKTKRPKLYKVLLHNDDYTPMDFVTHVLMNVFHKSFEESAYIMMKVHTRGLGMCGAFPKSVSEAKVNKVMDMARSEGHPLLCTMEPE
ncbi:MAG: ATP-dependent Clp protease adaptor ClpS [Lentisphaeraceae bacterium]|nr:ATP-dependent Clp protease adaptor ClpS [Lentisphaeraceae bacterium]